MNHTPRKPIREQLQEARYWYKVFNHNHETTKNYLTVVLKWDTKTAEAALDELGSKPNGDNTPQEQPKQEAEVSARAQFADPLPFFPAELKAKRNWVRWKLELVDGRWTKIPYQLTGKKASSTDPSTWNTYEAIVSGAVLSESEGIGIMTDGTFVGFDLDGCRNPATGEITEWAKRVIDTLGAYTEITPSGYGVRVLALGQLPDGARRFSLALSGGFGDKVGIETYDQARYFTMTGNRVGDCSSLQSPNVAQAYQLCADISREFPSEKRKQAAQFGGNDSGSSVVFTRKPGSLASKLSVLMYGKIVSNKPFVIENEHGDQVTAPSQSEADMSLATLLAMEHGDNPELIDADFCESSLYRPKWDRLAESQIAKAIASAKKSAETTPVETYTASAPPDGTQSNAQAQAQANAAEEASQETEGTFPEGEAVSEGIPEFDEGVITGSFRKLVDAVCNGTTIPRQYALHVAKAFACSILTKNKIKLEGCESARTYFVVFGETGTGKGLAFRRMTEWIIDKTQNITEFVKIIYAVDSEAGLRDAFFQIPENQNRPILYFVDEVKTLGQKADGKKNPEIVSGIIEMAHSTTVGRAKALKGTHETCNVIDHLNPSFSELDRLRPFLSIR